MKAERFRQIRNLFDAAMDRDPETRNAFLLEACQDDEDLLREIGRLLAAEGEPTAWIGETILESPSPRLEGRKIGPYAILRQLGQGGMGTVYLAVHADDPERKPVALKIVRPDATNEEVLRRFKREREILESLDHPNIARIQGGGETSDGLPYLVMDYINGKPIDVYCDEERLDLQARLRLFRDVCSAVHYAHEHHVVHRDLKPRNIFVRADGMVKLLDFGIARLATPGPDGQTSLTRTDLLLMTPEYASPEQVMGGLSTPATDVYALGIVLYELLTGRRPYHLPSRIFREIARVICEEPPTRPSASVTKKLETDAQSPESISHNRGVSLEELRRLLAGDLDYILLKALEKDPVRRYRSVQQFSQDLRLYLQGHAVTSRVHGFVKAAAQFALRRQWWLVGIGAVVLAVYSGIIVVPPAAGLAIVFVLSWMAQLYLLNPRIPFHEGTDSTLRTLMHLAKFLFSIGLVATVGWLITPRSWLENASLAIQTILLLSMWLLVLRWPRRGHYLGKIMFDMTHEGFRGQKILLLGGIAFGFLQDMFSFSFMVSSIFAGEAPRILFGSYRTISLLVILFLSVDHNEIRQRGLALTGRLVLWKDVMSFHWDPKPGEFHVMRVSVGGIWGLWGLFPPVRLYVPPKDRERVTAIFEQQLFEWPQES